MYQNVITLIQIVIGVIRLLPFQKPIEISEKVVAIFVDFKMALDKHWHEGLSQ